MALVSSNHACADVASLGLSGNALMTVACEAADRELSGGVCAVSGIGADPVIAAFRGNTAEDSALATTSNRQREYANQPSLDMVGAAFAYGEAGKRADDLDAALGAGFGTGSHISVVTSKRFDPTHPEFDSAPTTAVPNPSFETLDTDFCSRYSRQLWRSDNQSL